LKRVLLTGMSGVGKSTVIRALAAQGYKTVDTDDDGWCHLADVPGVQTGTAGAEDWVWREDRIGDLLSTEDADVLFVSGCTSNQSRFYPRFDRIVLLSAPVPLMIGRLASRANNPYGKGQGELDRILGHKETIEPLLRRAATMEVDTSGPLPQVLRQILDHVLG
jgi:shikimate kinase